MGISCKRLDKLAPVSFPGSSNVEDIARCYHAPTVKHLLGDDFRNRLNQDRAAVQLDPLGRLVGQLRTRDKIDLTEVIESDFQEAAAISCICRRLDLEIEALFTWIDVAEELRVVEEQVARSGPSWLSRRQRPNRHLCRTDR